MADYTSSLTPDRRPAAPQGRPSTLQGAQTAMSFKSFRTISPVLVPLGLGGASYFLLILIVLGMAPVHPYLGVEMLIPLFFIFAAVGVILAAFMVYANNETIWALAMLMGLFAYITLLVWAMFGPLIALSFIGGIALLTAVLIRRQLHSVMERTAHVMLLFGKYHRTLHPGFNLRWPGEQLWAIVALAPATASVDLHDLFLHGGTTIRVQAEATCTVHPQQVHLVADHPADWITLVQKPLEEVVREVLTDSPPEDIFDAAQTILELGDSAPLPVRIAAIVQQRVRHLGIIVAGVHLTLPRSPASSEHGKRTVATGKEAMHQPIMPDVAPEPQRYGRGLTPHALLTLPPSMQTGIPTPGTLIECYNAVRERRISDPQTIEAIARAFEQVAHDPVMQPHLPFAADEAARNLRALLSKLEATRSA